MITLPALFDPILQIYFIVPYRRAAKRILTCSRSERIENNESELNFGNSYYYYYYETTKKFQIHFVETRWHCGMGERLLVLTKCKIWPDLDNINLILTDFIDFPFPKSWKTAQYPKTSFENPPFLLTAKQHAVRHIGASFLQFIFSPIFHNFFIVIWYFSNEFSLFSAKNQ